MNSDFSNTPEDRLLDELLKEQAQGVDETFVQTIEAAIDQQPVSSGRESSSRRYWGLGIAAGLAVAAGVGIWAWPTKRATTLATAVDLGGVPRELPEPPRQQIVPDDLGKDSLARAAREVPADPFAANATPMLPSAIDESEEIASSVGFLKVGSFDRSLGLRDSGSSGGSGSGIGAGIGPGLNESYAPRVQALKADDPYDGSALSKMAEATSGDRYDSFIEQPWRSPNRDPLSTFSIDVDTASYSNVRRMIQEGRTIPRDAVRIEEFINAFHYHYAQPKGEGPFAVSADIASCPWAPTHQLVRVAIKGREIDATRRPPSNLVFLIDVSGSMSSSDKLPLLRRSLEKLVAQLDERDRVAIVVYAGSEGVALPSTRLDANGRAEVLKALDRLQAGGSTNGGAGIAKAYEIAMKEKAEGGVNRVILATDGDFNVGVTGQDALVNLVKERAKSGVYLTVLGFGSGNLNDSMMDAITRDGNGNYHYIGSEREGRKVFEQNLTGTLVTIAKDVKIQVEFNPAKVGGYRLIGYANRVLRNEDFNDDKVDAGDIGAGHTVTAFYEITPPGEGKTDELKYQAGAPKAAGSDEWLTVKLRHKHPEGDESLKTEFALKGQVQELTGSGADFQFATAAALFAMKLRGMDDVAKIGWETVIELARPGLKNDFHEERAEFVDLVKKVGRLDSPEESPRPRAEPIEVNRDH